MKYHYSIQALVAIGLLATDIGYGLAAVLRALGVHVHY
jgi:hypothetical protein